MYIRNVCLISGVFYLFAAATLAQEVSIEAGYVANPDVGEDAAIFGLGYRHAPFYENNRFSAALAANISSTAESDIFVGAGIALRWAWQSGWFLDLSVMPGYYDPGISGNDLGNDLEFRSLFGVGYAFESGQRLSLAVTHKSNAGLDDYNPGADAILLRFHVPL